MEKKSREAEYDRQLRSQALSHAVAVCQTLGSDAVVECAEKFYKFLSKK